MKRIFMVGAAMIFTASTAHAAECSTVTMTSSGSSVSVARTGSPALCSVTQDGSYASTIQMSVPVNYMRPSEMLEKKLNGVRLKLDPAKALSMASKIPPEQWTESQFVDIATVLIALSERGENMSTIRAYLENHGDSLYKAFARPANHERAERFDGLNPYSATVSYGCLELFRGGTYRSMVRVPKSSSQRQCDTW
jgi:hypothetical protein